MPALTNDFSWSLSRHRMFERCLRQYYYHYYESWNGWSASAPAMTQKLYHLKKLSNLPLLVGSCVHKEIEHIIDRMICGNNVSHQDSEQRVIARFKQTWRTSKRGADPRDRLREHYYKEQMDEAYLLSIKNLMIDCIRGFFTSEAYRILSSPGISILANEDLDSFTVDGINVWVNLDCAVQTESALSIFDWKTGKPSEGDELQLSIYTLYARHKWNADPADTEAYDVYLRPSLSTTISATPDIDEARYVIAESSAAMKACLDDPVRNTASIEQFPMTEHRTLCKTCPFKEVCRDETRRASKETQPLVHVQEPNSIIV